MHPRVKDLLERHQALYLDLNAQPPKDPRAVGMGRRPHPSIEIVHDLEDLPWPLPDGCCYRILAAHVIEFVKPWQVHAFMDECWRLLQDTGQLIVSTVYANSPQFWANPRHVHAWNELSPFHFVCGHPAWQAEQPQCWQLETGFPLWQSDGNLQVILNKVPGDHDAHTAAQEAHADDETTHATTATNRRRRQPR